MEPHRLAELRRIATAFRGAIEANPVIIPAIRPSCFPIAACDGTCFLFSSYLANLRFRPIEMVVGRRDHGNHAWLEVEGTFVDLTADQFSDGPGSVIVGGEDEWFGSFQILERKSPFPKNLERIPGLRESFLSYCNLLAAHLKPSSDLPQLR